MKIEEKEPLTNLERELVKAVVGHLGGNFHKSTVVARIAAKIALELAEKAYYEGRYTGREDSGLHKIGDGKTFKQFIQDYE